MQAHHWTLIPSHLAEGITVFATEHADTECSWLTSWSNLWLAIRQRAKVVLERDLKGQEDTIDVAVLEVEIDRDDDKDEALFDVDEE